MNFMQKIKLLLGKTSFNKDKCNILGEVKSIDIDTKDFTTNLFKVRLESTANSFDSEIVERFLYIAGTSIKTIQYFDRKKTETIYELIDKMYKVIYSETGVKIDDREGIEKAFERNTTSYYEFVDVNNEKIIRIIFDCRLVDGY